MTTLLSLLVNLTLIGVGYGLAWSIYARRLEQMRRSREHWKTAAYRAQEDARFYSLERWRQP